ncbi:MAG: EAL domain-containing protein [Xanthomonadaceae bacterium]|nr:EAL domain-containing protein [Xanthomonadaceae bacterium]
MRAFSSHSPDKPLRVLLVEDSPADAELLVRELDRCLESFTWERVDTLAALNLALLEQPDFALVDIVMPSLDGTEALRAARLRWPDLPIIVVTGNLDDRLAARVLDAGASDYLLKDRLGRLGGAIERALHVRWSREQASSLIGGQNRILSGIATGAPLASTLEAIVRLVEAQAPGMLCSILRVVDGVLRPGAGPSMPDVYNKAADGHPIGPSVGTCGTAAWSGVEVVVTDIERDPLWEGLHEYVLPFGLRASWARPVCASNGKVLGVFSMYYTERRGPTDDERRLLDIGVGMAGVALQKASTEASQKLALQVISELAEGVMIFDREFRLVDANPAFVRVVGWRLNDVKGTTPDFLSPDGEDAALARDIRTALDTQGNWQGEISWRRKSGERFPALMSFSAVHSEGVLSHYVGVFNDISTSRDYEQRLAYLSSHDPLTQLVNREAFTERLNSAMTNARRAGYCVGVIVLDIDNFKTVNDSLGHAAGDQMLQTVAARLRDLVRDTDVIARLGGDEFAVLLAEVDLPDDCAVFIERVFEAMRAPFLVDGHEVFATCSAGVSVFPSDTTQSAMLLGNADAAMYRAKAAGRNTYQFFSSEMNTQTLENLVLANSLRHALAQDEFVLHYQPRFVAKTRVMTGVEALVRWLHPDQGLVPPGKFIPVAEDTGLIGDIGEWVLREACRQAMAWRAQGHPPICMAVNLSARQLQSPGFGGQVARVLEETGLPPGDLELEITESMLMRDPMAAAATIANLHGLGVRIAIDDFGTGYSSLSYLKQFTIDDIKIDRAFVTGLPDDADDIAIVRAIIAVAASLGMRTVAEGVETDAQLNCLTGLSCDEVQGYLLGRPLPADKLVF